MRGVLRSHTAGRRQLVPADSRALPTHLAPRAYPTDRGAIWTRSYPYTAGHNAALIVAPRPKGCSRQVRRAFERRQWFAAATKATPKMSRVERRHLVFGREAM